MNLIILAIFLLAPGAADNPGGKIAETLAICPPSKYRFEGFERDLKYALAKQDPLAMALLVEFPLSVHEPGRGTILISSADALLPRFSQIFTSAIRDLVLKDKSAAEECSRRGINYGSGSLLVNVVGEGQSARYAVTQIDASADADNLPEAQSVEFICHADALRLVIDRNQTESLRVRGWQHSRPLSEGPNLEFLSGTMEWQGTGPCSSAHWSFDSSDVSIHMSSLGCSPDSSPPPRSAKGRIEISGNSEFATSGWCF